MKSKLTLVIAIFVFVLMSSVFASAISGKIGSARVILYPEAGNTIERTIKVINDNPVSVTIKLEVKEDSIIDLIDEEFVLEANQEKNAKFVINVDDEGAYEERINVYFTPLNGEPGVVLTSVIYVLACEGDDCKIEDSVTGEEIIDSGSVDVSPDINGQATEDTGSDGKGNGIIIVLGITFLVLLLVLATLLTKMKKRDTNEDE